MQWVTPDSSIHGLHDHKWLKKGGVNDVGNNKITSSSERVPGNRLPGTGSSYESAFKNDLDSQQADSSTIIKFVRCFAFPMQHQRLHQARENVLSGWSADLRISHLIGADFGAGYFRNAYSSVSLHHANSASGPPPFRNPYQ